MTTSSDTTALASRLYREFHTRCFWHCPRDLRITEDLVPFVAKGLRAHGGRKGFMLAARLRPMTEAESHAQRISFAYGNVRMHNPAITMADIERAAHELDRERSGDNQ